MTTVSSTVQLNLQYITNLFRDKKVHKVAIIDDVDDPRSESEFYANEKNDFWSELAYNNTDAMEEMNTLVREKLNREIDKLQDIDDIILQFLWSSRAELKELKRPVEEILFAKALEKVNELDRFQNHLATLDLNVLREGTNIDIEEVLKEVSIVFIDYVLGPESNLKSSVERAETIAARIYSAFSNNEMPLIILMSNHKHAAQDEERFRDKSGLLRGMFYFVTKRDLKNKEKLFLNLSAWVKTLPISVDIQRFIKTLEDSTLTVWHDFISGVKSLALEDYAYIQNLSLQEDGHPLGDYMLWLYNSYLGHLLFESHKAMQEQQKIVDGLNESYLPPNQTMPSTQLVKMYQSSLFNMSVGELSGHPVIEADTHSDKAGQTSNDLIPYLHLGDIFIKEGSDYVLMVINAECDLAFGPKRVCDINGQVLFIPGELQPPEKWGEGFDQTRTEFFEYEGKRYRIVWDVKKIHSYKHSEIHTQLTGGGYKRKARLRLPFALEVQRAFAANLTRVGMPVAPPIYHPVSIEVWAKGEEKTKINLIKAQDGLAFWILTKKKNVYVKQLFFTVEFGQLFKEAVNLYTGSLKDQMEGIAGNSDEAIQKKAERLRKRIIDLDEFIAVFEKWFLELLPLTLPENTVKEIYVKLIGLCRGVKVKDSSAALSLPILINIIGGGDQEHQGSNDTIPSMADEGEEMME